MASIDMNLIESLHYVRSTTLFLNAIRKQLEEYIDVMPLPEGTDNLKRANIKLWLQHYMNGICSFESLNNILKYWGVSELLKPPIHEIEVNEDGELKIFKTT